jgi:hypothetical protein
VFGPSAQTLNNSAKALSVGQPARALCRATRRDIVLDGRYLLRSDRRIRRWIVMTDVGDNAGQRC